MWLNHTKFSEIPSPKKKTLKSYKHQFYFGLTQFVFKNVVPVAMHLQKKCRPPSLDDIYNVGIFDLKLKILAEGGERE